MCVPVVYTYILNLGSVWIKATLLNNVKQAVKGSDDWPRYVIRNAACIIQLRLCLQSALIALGLLFRASKHVREPTNLSLHRLYKN